MVVQERVVSSPYLLIPRERALSNNNSRYRSLLLVTIDIMFSIQLYTNSFTLNIFKIVIFFKGSKNKLVPYTFNLLTIGAKRQR